MIGSICGDIIGSVFEWHNVKSQDFDLFSRESRFTDDTVMTVAVADKLLSCENIHKLGNSTAMMYAARYRQYYSRHPHAGFGQMFSDWAKKGDFAKQKSYANGAAMRVAPIGYAFDNINAVIKEARLSCLYTHNHREAIQGAEAVAGCVFLARTGASKDEIKDFVVKKIGYNLDFSLDIIRPDYKFDSRTSYSVPPAISAFLESEDYESAIRKAISIGGDSDTIACIAGGIAHAFYKSIPKPIYDKCMSLLDSGLKKTVKEFIKSYNISVYTADKSYSRSKVEELLRGMGFIDTMIHFSHKLPDGTESEKVFKCNDLYCRINFFKNKDTFGNLKDWIVLEYAENLHEAQLHMYEDGDPIPLDVEIDVILSELKTELQKAKNT